MIVSAFFTHSISSVTAVCLTHRNETDAAARTCSVTGYQTKQISCPPPFSFRCHFAEQPECGRADHPDADAFRRILAVVYLTSHSCRRSRVGGQYRVQVSYSSTASGGAPNSIGCAGHLH